MKCASCSTSNPAGASYCSGCGEPLGLVCDRCGFPIPANARFCGGCGMRVEHVQANDPRGERRLLTVMFCDLVGSVQLSRVLDPEDLAPVLALYQRIVGDAVQEFDGEVSNYIGDGIVIHFGYPRAHEDDAQRAVRCGLEILRRIDEARRDSSVAGADRLQARLGLHTGEVLVNPIGVGERITSIALGDVPNVAARVQSEAASGTLAVSDATWRLVRGYVHGTDLGERLLKGVEEPVRLWQVDRANPSQERVEVSDALTPLVGRDAEQQQLQAIWDEVASSGAAHFVLLVAEPGMGKSRLARAACERAEEAGGSVVLLRSTPYNSASPYQPLIEHLDAAVAATGAETDTARREALRSMLEACGADDEESIALVAPLLSLPVDDLPPLALSPIRQRGRTMDLLVQLLTAPAATAPLLLAVEDLHWADASTLELTERLVASGSDVPMLVLLTARPELDVSWPEVPWLRTMELGRLDERNAADVIRHVAGSKALPAELTRLLLLRSDGVPLFVEEMTKALLDSDRLVERSASWEVAGPLPDDTIPASVHASLTARIDRLGPSRSTAQLAAAIGREFSLELLTAVSDRAPTTVQADLDRLVHAGLAFAEDEHGETFVFKHALVRDAAYNSLLRSTRQQYHRQIADTLRDRFPAIATDRPDLIADHLTRAGAPGDAVAYWQAAAQQAMGRAAFREATSFLERAVACVSEVPETPEVQALELELQSVLAPLLMTVKGWSATDVETACHRALELAAQLERYDAMYPPLWGLWTVLFLRGQLEPALGAAQRVLEMAIASGVPMIESTGRHATAYTHLYRGELAEALREAEAGIALFDLDQERVLADTFQLSSGVCLSTARASALWLMGRLDEALEEWERMRWIAAELAHPPSLAAALAFDCHLSGYRWSYSAQLHEVRPVAEELVTLCREEGFALWHGVGCAYLGMAMAAEGDPEAARRQIQEGLELFQQTGARLTLVMMNLEGAEALLRHGDDPTALLDAAEAEMVARSEGMMAPEIWRVRGRWHRQQGREEEARAAFVEARTRAAAQGALLLELRALVDLVDAPSRRPDDVEALRSVYGRFTQGFDLTDLRQAARLVDSVGARSD